MALLGYSQIYSIVDAFGDIDRLLYIAMHSSSSPASHAGMSDNLSCSITGPAYLLNNERALSYSLITLTAAGAAYRSRCSRFHFSAFACATCICPSKTNRLLSTIDSIHEINLLIYHDVLALSLSFCSSTSFLVAAEHLLELIKNVAERTLTACASLRSSKLIREAFESSESLSTSAKGTSTSKGTLATKRILSLLVSRHSSLVVDAALIIVVESLIRIVYLAELLLRLGTRIDIRMILLGEFEVCLLDVSGACVSIQVE